ncbi:MAG: peptidoglycan D,D-transpeptidase FtsI family protein [Agathobacter sp.]
MITTSKSSGNRKKAKANVSGKTGARHTAREKVSLENPIEKIKEQYSDKETGGFSWKKLFAVRNPKKGKNKEFAIITYLFMAIFICMIGYFIYFMGFKSEDLINSAYNPRLSTLSEHVVRGDILSQDGVVLATTKTAEDGTETRVYPYNDMFAHVVGYASNGNYGVESSANFQLLRSHSFFLKQILNDISDEKNQGDSVVTTLDYDVQEAAYEALGNQDGAVVVIEVETGKILGMVSKPDFDPNTIAEKWDKIIEDNDNAPLLNRATQGLYPPGSTFKVITALEYIREKGLEADYSFDCEGEVTVNGTQIHCAGDTAHGEVDLVSAFAKSCNTTFSSIGLELNVTKWQDLASQLLFNKKLPTRLDAKQSRFSLSVDDEEGKVMQTSIGQGDTLVTPLYMAQLTAAIANDGVMMESYVIDSILRDNGSVVKSYKASEYGSVISKKEAEKLQLMMKEVVNSGTGNKLSGQSYEAAGKTGSAEFSAEKNHTHAWFIGYGSKEAYNDIAIAVIVEDGGSGSSAAVPIAKKVFDVYFNQNE